MENPQQPVTPAPNTSMKENVRLAIAVGGIFLLGLAFAAGYFFGAGSRSKSVSVAVLPESSSLPSTEPQEVVCTMDAKLCPDGSFVGRVGPNCEFTECPVENKKITTDTIKFIVKSYALKSDDKGNTIPNSSADIFLLFPKGFSVQGKLVTVAKSKFEVNVNMVAGLCPMDATQVGCSYTDEKTPRGDLLRLWKNEKGIFALNLMPVAVNGYYIESIVVTKTDGYTFSSQEITQWKEIFQTLDSEKAE